MIYADVSDLINDVDSKPETPIKEGISNFIDWYREYSGRRLILKILHVINGLDAGGAEKLLEESLPLLNQKKDLEIELLLLTKKNNVFLNNILESGIKVHYSKYKNPKNPLNIFYIRNIIKNGNYDIVHGHLFPTLYWISLASIFIPKKIKFVFTEHNTYNRRMNIKLLRPIEKFIYSKFDKIICVSEEIKNNLKNWLKSEKINQRMEVIENGVNLDKFKNAKRINLNKYTNINNENVKYITMVSRFTPQKDHETLLKALDKLPLNVHLILVGEGPLKEKYINLSKEMNIQDRVHFLGFRKDVPTIMKSSDIIVQASNWEGFGLTAVEAMATGTPLVATEVPGLKGVVFNGGLLFKKNDVEDLVNKINLLLNNKEYYEEISKKGLYKSKQYSIENMINKIIDLYRELI